MLNNVNRHIDAHYCVRLLCNCSTTNASTNRKALIFIHKARYAGLTQAEPI